MPMQLWNSGTTDAGVAYNSKKLVLEHSNGTAYYVDIQIISGNNTLVISSGNAARTAVTALASSTSTNLYAGVSGARIVACMGHDETYILVAYVGLSSTVKCKKYTIATNTWSAEEAAYPTTANVAPLSLDMSINQQGAAILAFTYTGTTGDKFGYVSRIRTTAAAWVAGAKTTVNATMTLKTHNDVAVGWYTGIGSATARRFAVIVSMYTTTGDGGIFYYHNSVNETTGASLSTKTVNWTAGIAALSGSLPILTQQARKIWLWTNAFGSTLTFATMTRGSANAVNAGTGFSFVSTVGANAAADTVQMLGQESSIVANGLDAKLAVMCATTSFVTGATYNVNFLVPSSPSSSTPSNLVSSLLTKIQPVFASGNLNGISRVDTALQDFNCSAPLGSVKLPSAIFGNDAANPGGPANSKRHDVICHYLDGGSTFWNIATAFVIPVVLTNMSPAPGQTVASSKPPVSITVSNNVWTKDPPLVSCGFRIASDAPLSVSTKDWISPLAQMGPYSAGSTTLLNSVWAGLAVPPGAWYLGGYILDTYGNEWSAGLSGGTVVSGGHTYGDLTGSSFTVAHPPYSDNLNPTTETGVVDNGVNPYLYSDPLALGYTQVPVSWDFVDSWDADTQSAYQIDVVDRVLGTTIYSTGKVTSTAKNGIARVPFASKNNGCSYTVTLWDFYDTTTVPVVTGYFVTYTGPTVDTVGLVTQTGGLENSTTPVFSYTITPGLYNTTSLDVVVTQGSTVLYSGSLLNPGTAGNFVVPYPIVQNTQNYTVTMYAVDENGLTSSRSLNFTTSWVAPPGASGVAVSTASYNVENLGYVLVSWNNSTQDANFLQWNIYRRVDTLGPDGVTVVATGPYVLIGSDTGFDVNHTFKDYYAPSGSKVGYSVTQVYNNGGSIVETTGFSPVFVFPVSDGYWLIDPTSSDPNAISFKLFNVTEDSYTETYEEEQLHVIGRGIKIDRGDYLGASGSMTAKLRDTGSTTARQKKLRLEYLKKQVRNMFMRTPFGDTLYVSIGNMQIDRIAGVGTSEFVDVTLPYQEVYSG